MRLKLYSFFFLISLVFQGVALAAPQVAPSERVRSRVIVRAAPTTESAPIDALEPGETLEVISSVPNWYEVRLPDGRVGYVSRGWTVLLDETAARPFKIHFVDVGTGLAVFVEGRDFTLLYDGGSNDDLRLDARNRLLAYLRHVRPELRTIDHMVLSHPHRDHVELLPDVLEAYQVRHVWDSGRNNPICGYRAFLEQTAQEAGAEYHNALAGTGPHIARFPARTCYGRARPAVNLSIPRGSQIRAGSSVSLGAGARMTFLHADGLEHASANENSLVVRLDLGNRRILLMGDAEAGGRRDPSTQPGPDSIEGKLLSCCVADVRADVLVVGHHGSMTSSRTAFLDAVGATDFAVSAGPTRYGSVTLPDQVVITELSRRGRLWRTDVNDAACRADPTKIGPDADGRPGGCDNFQMLIGQTGIITATYYRQPD